MMSNPSTTARSPQWRSVQSAATMLGLTAAALRKALDRRAVRRPDGGIEAELDGVRGRKLGRLWRVSLSAAWSNPVHKTPDDAVSSPHREDAESDREGQRS